MNDRFVWNEVPGQGGRDDRRAHAADGLTDGELGARLGDYDDADDLVAADPTYRVLLREAMGRVPLDEVDWGALHDRVTAAAELPLARRRAAAAAAATRAAPTWWDYAARRAGAALSLAVAASLLLVAYVHTHPVDESSTPGATAAAEARAAFDAREAFASTVTAGTASRGITRLLVSSAADAEELAVMSTAPAPPTTTEGVTP